MLIKCWWIAFLGGLFTLPAFAQGYNFVVGGGPGFPLGRISDYTNTSYNFVAGAGPNLHSHVKMSAEFMFHGLPVQRKIIDQLGFSDVKGRLYSLSGNLLVGSSAGGTGKSGYLIAGGGWYRRTFEAKQTVLKAGEVCGPEFILWGIECVNGIFATDVTVGSRTSSAWGFNVGAGLGFRLGDSDATFYTEVRYHYAFTRDVETAVLPVTFGIRW